MNYWISLYKKRNIAIKTKCGHVEHVKGDEREKENEKTTTTFTSLIATAIDA